MKALELAAEDSDEEYARLARTCLSLENEKMNNERNLNSRDTILNSGTDVEHGG